VRHRVAGPGSPLDQPRERRRGLDERRTLGAMEGEALGNRTGRCPTCAAAVEPDWLTCRSCGAILASIRRPAQTGAAPPAATPAPNPPRPSDPTCQQGHRPRPGFVVLLATPPPRGGAAATEHAIGPHRGHLNWCRALRQPRARPNQWYWPAAATSPDVGPMPQPPAQPASR
jgi:hypothetical protein